MSADIQVNVRMPQRGNVQAQQIVHERTKLFSCKLDHCSKLFTQLGNLKVDPFDKSNSESLLNHMVVTPEQVSTPKRCKLLLPSSRRGRKGTL